MLRPDASAPVVVKKSVSLSLQKGKVKSFVPVIFSPETRARTKGVVQQHALLRRVFGRVLETAFEKVLRRVLRRCLAVGRRVIRRDSKKGS